MNPSGGLARRAWLIEQVKKALPDAAVLLADTGNFSDNPTPAGEAKTRSLLEGMARLGYQVVNVGERDLVSGYDALKARTEGLPLTFVSSNLVRHDTKEPIFKPYTVLKLQGGKGRKEVRVGVLGVVRFNPVFQKAGPGGANVVIAPPLDALQKLVPEVRKQADVVVLLAALHRDDARALARSVPGIDFVLGAFANTISPTEDETEGTTQLRYVGNQGKYVSESRVSLGPDGKVVSVSNYMHTLTARYPDDPATLQWLAGQINKIPGHVAPASAGPGAH
jgi:5'-nucleotidase/UDP-sugar diphosphatase